MVLKDLTNIENPVGKRFWICAYDIDGELHLYPTYVEFEKINKEFLCEKTIFQVIDYNKNIKKKQRLSFYMNQYNCSNIILTETKDECKTAYKMLIGKSISYLEDKLFKLKYEYEQKIKNCEKQISDLRNF